MNDRSLIAARLSPRRLTGCVIAAALRTPPLVSLGPLFESRVPTWQAVLTVGTILFLAYACDATGGRLLPLTRMLVDSTLSLRDKVRRTLTDRFGIAAVAYAMVFTVLVALKFPPVSFAVALGLYLVTFMAMIVL
jgi:hypothetical protein